MSKPAVITTWQGYQDYNIDLPGFDIGDEIELRLWSVTDNKEKRVEVDLNDSYYGTSPLSYGSAVVYNMDPSPSEFYLSPAYPNPFNPVTNIEYGLPKDAYVSISVYNVNGKLLEEILNKNQDLGYYQVRWDASSYATGLYFIKLIAGDYQNTQKVMLIK